MRIIFMGTPEFSVSALDTLHAAGHEIVAVYSQPPRPAGRGKKERKGAVHQRAEALGLQVYTPTSLKDPAVQATFDELRADVAVVVAYGLLLPLEILQSPKFGCLNIHASLLPRWRGAAPIHRAIMAGDADTGVCIMQMDEGLDTGPVLLKEQTKIGDIETTSDLHDRLAEVGAGLVVEAVGNIQSLSSEPQPSDGVTYAAKIAKADARIDWTKPAIEIDRLIRGLSPFPGAWCEMQGERVKLLRSKLASGAGEPGQILPNFDVACGQGSVEIMELQLPGKGRTTAADFLRGHTLPNVLT